MKSLIKSIRICLESILDDDDIFFDPKNDRKHVEEWIKNTYKIRGKLTISDDLVINCAGDVTVKNMSTTSLTNGLFRWGKVGGYFDCGNCKNLTSLKGAPEKVNGSFWCDHCEGLETLDGAPKEVGRNFWCNDCDNLKSLEGVPKSVGGNFYCGYCGALKTLEGAPEKVGGDFNCNGCPSLEITDSDRKKYKIKD